MPVLRPNAAPPPHYYADNLMRLLCAVERQYIDILRADERDYVQRVAGLSNPALRLYARLITRKGPLIRVDSLVYREVDDVQCALGELERAGLACMQPEFPADRHLTMLTRDELHALFRYVRAQRKPAQVDTIAARYPDRHVRARIAVAHPMCVPLGLEMLGVAQILFFGDAHTDLSTFVLEDLGMLRFEAYPLDRSSRQFVDRDELDDYLSMHAQRDALNALEGTWHGATALEVLELLWPIRQRRALERVRAGLVNRLGRAAERAHDYDVALAAYGRATRAPGRERRVRLLRRLGDGHGATALLDAIEREPVNAGERFFAHRFRDRSVARTRRVAERVVRLASSPEAGVEAAALDWLTRDRGTGAHLENLTPLGMLGLAFWDVVFAPIDAAFVNPYQRGPLDLYWSDFRRARAALIEQRLAALTAPGALERVVLGTARAKRGISNALVDWHALDDEMIDALTTSVPAGVWLHIFDYMLDDLEQTRTGFPDLALCFGRDDFEFVEVKGPGDQLRREQRLWFEFFAAHDIRSSVLRVEW